DRSKNYGYLQVASNLGYIGGPAVAGILATTMLGEKLPVGLAVVVAVLASFFIAFYLPESHKKLQEKESKKPKLSEAIKQPVIVYLLVMYFLLYIGYNIYYTAFPLNTINTLHWSVGKLGIYFSILSLMMVIVQGPVLSKISKLFSEHILILAGTFFLGINFLLIITQQDIQIYLASAFFALGNGLMWPSLLSVISKNAGAYQGTIQGFSGSLAGLASIVGLIGGGLLFNHFSGNTFYVSAGLFFFVVLMSLKLFTIKK
ncbi:MAG TPA: MFS transporter, partial [Patescibacteria group bacterium]|nr:MFS transporter [Patescibacteria group bacterium]